MSISKITCSKTKTNLYYLLVKPVLIISENEPTTFSWYCWPFSYSFSATTPRARLLFVHLSPSITTLLTYDPTISLLDQHNNVLSVPTPSEFILHPIPRAIMSILKQVSAYPKLRVLQRHSVAFRINLLPWCRCPTWSGPRPTSSTSAGTTFHLTSLPTSSSSHETPQAQCSWWFLHLGHFLTDFTWLPFSLNVTQRQPFRVPCHLLRILDIAAITVWLASYCLQECLLDHCTPS